MNFETKGLQNAVCVADGVVVPAEIAARFRGWEHKGSSPSGFPLYRVQDDHRQCIVHVKWARFDSLPKTTSRSSSSHSVRSGKRSASGDEKSQRADALVFPSAAASLASSTKAGAVKRLPLRNRSVAADEDSSASREGPPGVAAECGGVHSPSLSTARAILRDNVALQLRLKHPRIAPMHQAIFTSQWMMTVAPELTGGSLMDRIRFGSESDVPWSEYTVASIVRSVLEALHYVHREGLRYGTVHPSSLLYASPTSRTDDVMLSSFSGTCAVSSPGETMTARVNGDMHRRGLRFGSLPFLSPEEVVELLPFLTVGDGPRPSGAPHTALGSCRDDHSSSPLRASPEGREVGYASDMWSVGVLTHYLLSGTLPFSGRSQWLTLAAIASCGQSASVAVEGEMRRHKCIFSPERAMRTTPPFVWPTPDLTPEAIASCRGGERAYRESELARGSPYAPALDFIACCCAADPTLRITAARALKHPWIACSDVAEQQSRLLPQSVLELLQRDEAGVAASRPQPLGRFADIAHEYQARCRRTSSTAPVDSASSALTPKANSGLLESWSSCGSWSARESFVLDAHNLRLGPVGCQAAVAAVVSCAVRSHGHQHPLRLVSMDLRDNGLHDDSLSALCALLGDPLSRCALRYLRRWDLRGNPRITNRGVRSVIHLLRIFGSASPEPADTDRALDDSSARLRFDVLLDTQRIAPRLVAELSAMTGGSCSAAALTET